MYLFGWATVEWLRELRFVCAREDEYACSVCKYVSRNLMLIRCRLPKPSLYAPLALMHTYMSMFIQAVIHMFHIIYALSP